MSTPASNPNKAPALFAHFAGGRNGLGISAASRYLQGLARAHPDRLEQDPKRRIAFSESKLRDLYFKDTHGRQVNTARRNAARAQVERLLAPEQINRAIDPKGLSRSAPLSKNVRETPAHAGFNVDAVEIGRWGPNGGPLPFGAQPLAPGAVLAVLHAAEAKWPRAYNYGLHIYGEAMAPGGAAGLVGGKRGRSPKVAKLDIVAAWDDRLTPAELADAGIDQPIGGTLQNFGATPTYLELGIPAEAGTLDNPYGILFDELRADIGIVDADPTMTRREKTARRKALRDRFAGRWATRVSPYVWNRVYYIKIWRAVEQLGPER